MESQPDFLYEKSILEIVINQAGYEAVFYPMFYCEINYIEYY
jgi:hypothetical protein